MKKLMAMFLCLVMCGVFAGCSVNEKTRGNGHNNSSQEQSYNEKGDDKKNTGKIKNLNRAVNFTVHNLCL